MAIRILVVDDASFIRDMVKRNLREKIPHVEVYDAVDGNRACALLKGQKVDLILSDWEMPGMSGEEFLRWVRGHESFADIPFIMVTSRGDREFVIKAIEAGVSDYISKPFTPEELIRKTVKQLQKLGLAPSGGAVKGQTQGVAGASVDVLTGGAAPKPQKAVQGNALGADTLSALTGSAGAKTAPKAATSASASALTAAPTAPAQPQKKPKKTKGQAQLRFASGDCTCVVREMSLQGLNGLMQRSDKLPTVFDQAVVDIGTDGGESVARINGYVHSISAAEKKAESNTVKIIINFVDNDAEKFEVLSKYIAAL